VPAPPRRLPRRPLVATLIVTAVLSVGLSLVLTGCSGDDSPSSDPSATSLPTGFSALDEADFYPEVLAAQRAGGSVHVDSEAVPDDGDPVPSSADLVFHDDKTDVHSTTRGATGVLETVLVGDQFYAKGLSADGPPWWHVDLTAKSADSQVLGGILAQADPARQLAALSDPESFELVGAAEIDGEPVAHYRLTVDAATYYDKLGSQAPEDAGTINLDLWLDRTNRPLRTVTTSGQGVLRTTTTSTYTDYGAGTPVTPPPPGQVTTQSPFAK